MKRTNKASEEDVLYAFSVEPEKDFSTLNHYLKAYPQHHDALIDLSTEFLASIKEQEVVSEDREVSTSVEKAWTKFQSTLEPTETVHTVPRQHKLDSLG